jgi:F0F1-type ATP synthase membrane subunit c/vacuolar-type H+-ATPase subunit K
VGSLTLGLVFRLSLPPGLFFDHFGCRLTALLAALLAGGGYSLMWASTTGMVTRHPVAVGFFFFLVGHGTISLVSFLVGVHSFRRQSRQLHSRSRHDYQALW